MTLHRHLARESISGIRKTKHATRAAANTGKSASPGVGLESTLSSPTHSEYTAYNYIKQGKGKFSQGKGGTKTCHDSSIGSCVRASVTEARVTMYVCVHVCQENVYVKEKMCMHLSNQPFTAAGTPARRMEGKAAVVPQQHPHRSEERNEKQPQQHAHQKEERNEKQQPSLKNQSPQGRTPTTGLVRGSFRETQGALCSPTPWEWRIITAWSWWSVCYDFGVNTKGLRRERIVRRSRKGRWLDYVSVVGPAASLESLDKQQEPLTRRGWRVGWGDKITSVPGNGVGGWHPWGMPTFVQRVR